MQSVNVAFKEAVPVEWLTNMQGVAGVKNVQPTLFNIECQDAELIKKQILQLSLDKNLNIVSLQSESRSLEDVFKTLTN